MAKARDYSPAIRKRIDEMRGVLAAMGVPGAGTDRRNDCMAMAVLAAAGIEPESDWSLAKCVEDRAPRTREIIAFVNEHYSQAVSDGSYDDVRRSWLKGPRAHHVVESSSHTGSHNKPTRGWGVSLEAVKVIRAFGTDHWAEAIEEWLSNRGSLSERMKQQRALTRTTVTLPEGGSLELGPGSHNTLIRAIIEEFLPRYGYDAVVLYVGDAEDRHLLNDARRLAELAGVALEAECLPDVVAYSADRNWMFLIEAVTSSGPMSYLRVEELASQFGAATCPIIFVTAFLDRTDMRKFLPDLAWETEVWLSSDPDHMIHLNGDKFMGPYVSES